MWNLTSNFGKDGFVFADNDHGSSSEPCQTILEIKPTNEVVPGNYAMTVGAGTTTILLSQSLST
ncbi:MAG: hypothetical protein M3162_07445 [Thermoproteota archaeon]|nr:hypothetical protein [Thermoproteota archaeon]